MQQGESSGDLALDRLVFFSDAVFAIAITLLIIEIEIPDLQPGVSVAESVAEFAGLKWSFFAFVLSFLVIGRFWMGHHERFRSLRHYDARLMWANLLYLMAIAFMPFATAFLGRNIGHFLPALVYNLAMLALAVLAMWLARIIRRIAGSDLHGDGIDIVLAALVCVAMTFWIPLFSQWGMITIPLWAWLERRLALRSRA